jgi:hypothetical protein
VRTRKRLLRARVKGWLPISYTDEALTAHAGLALFERFLARAGWTDRLRESFAGRGFDTDYGSFRMTLELDPVFRRFAKLGRLPSERTLSRWLKEMTGFYRQRLRRLLRDVAFATWCAAALARVTLDVDGTVIRAGAKVQGAERGFNPRHPKDPSYYPLTAHLAQTGQVLDVVNRPGNVNDSIGAVDLLRDLIADVRQRLGAVPIEVRLGWRLLSEARSRASGGVWRRVRHEDADVAVARRAPTDC